MTEYARAHDMDSWLRDPRIAARGFASIDLFVNRRGPILRRYLDEAIRVARPGAVIVGLHPTGNTPAPTWRDQLPEPYQTSQFLVPLVRIRTQEDQ